MRTTSSRDNYDSAQMATFFIGLAIAAFSVGTILIANDIANEDNRALVKEQRMKAMAISIEEYKARDLNTKYNQDSYLRFYDYNY